MAWLPVKFLHSEAPLHQVLGEHTRQNRVGAADENEFFVYRVVPACREASLHARPGRALNRNGLRLNANRTSGYGAWSESTAPSCTSTARCAAVTPAKPVMSMRS